MAMARKSQSRTSKPVTKGELRRLERKMDQGSEQLVVMGAASLKLTLKEVHTLRKRVECLERKVGRRQ